MLSPIIRPGTFEHKDTLHKLELTAESLSDVGARILAGFNQATDNDALSAAGTYAYLAGVRALRDVLSPQGWMSHRKSNLEMIVPPSKQIAVIVSSSDKYTGLDGQEPRTKNEKGNGTKEMVRRNRNQASLFAEYETSPEDCNLGAMPTWFLLYHVDVAKSEMRMELALPISMDIDDLRIDQWRERIRLPAIKFDSTPSGPGYDFTGDDFNIEIKRKSNA